MDTTGRYVRNRSILDKVVKSYCLVTITRARMVASCGARKKM